MGTDVVTVYFDHKPVTFIDAEVAGIHEGWLYVREYDLRDEGSSQVRHNGFELTRVQGVYAETLNLEPDQITHIVPEDSDLYRSTKDDS